MKSKAYRVTFPVTIVVVMVTFLSIIFLADANQSYAASGKKKTAAVANISAVEHTEARIKQLEDALSFSADQEVLWNNLTQVMRENAKSLEERAAGSKPLNALDRMKYHSQTTEIHLDQMKKILPPFEALYITMSDEQKKITDALFRTGKHERHKMK